MAFAMDHQYGAIFVQNVTSDIYNVNFVLRKAREIISNQSTNVSLITLDMTDIDYSKLCGEYICVTFFLNESVSIGCLLKTH